MRALRPLFVAVALALFASAPAWAKKPLEEAQLAELNRVRAEVATQVQLSAYDLLDELVYGWMTEPVFQTPTPVVVAGVTVPVGLGTGLQAMLENHLANLLTENPACNLQLVHCPSCTAVLVHAGPEGTVVSRGIDNPALLSELGVAGGKHALFIDVEAEGTWLVLRARLTELNPDLPIVWSRTLSTTSSTPSMLRQPDDLKSAADAQQEYLAALRERGQLAIPLRVGFRSYAAPDEDTYTDSGGVAFGVAPPPFLWVQSGVELSMTDARAWLGSFMLGYSLIPQAYQGLMAQARVSRLLTGSYRSLTRPDLYFFGGATIATVWGPATGSFANDALDAEDLLTQINGDDPRAIFGTLHAGLDLRLGNRIGISGFMEFLPSFRNSDNFGAYVIFLGLPIQAFGTEVTFWL